LWGCSRSRQGQPERPQIPARRRSASASVGSYPSCHVAVPACFTMEFSLYHLYGQEQKR
jgi:hypothetical protein